MAKEDKRINMYTTVRITREALDILHLVQIGTGETIRSLVERLALEEYHKLELDPVLDQLKGVREKHMYKDAKEASSADAPTDEAVGEELYNKDTKETLNGN